MIDSSDGLPRKSSLGGGSQLAGSAERECVCMDAMAAAARPSAKRSSARVLRRCAGCVIRQTSSQNPTETRANGAICQEEWDVSDETRAQVAAVGVRPQLA